MKGFLRHLLMTLKLNFRNPQAVVFGYLVPVFFLFAYAVLNKKHLELLMGQLLTISVLGGACFGMPVALVSERERGVWRRYRLTPMPTAAFVLSVLLSRYFIVLTAALLQLALAMKIYDLPTPRDPWGLFLAYTCVAFALLGIGLVISMVANSTHAVQAIGQSLFLPMILIGGVGVPLEMLPDWMKHVATFLPGRYAVQALDRTILKFPETSTIHTSFNLVALLIIGTAATIAAGSIFRWENAQKLARRGLLWVAFCIASWAAVGLIAEHYHYVIPAKKVAATPAGPAKGRTNP